MTQKIEKHIANIQTRFQILITVSGLYSAILYNFFHLNDAPNSDNIFLKSSTLVVYYIIGWIIFEAMKNRLNEKWLQWMEVLLLVTVASFIFPMVIATENTQILHAWQQWLVYLSSGLQQTMVITIILLPLLIGAAQEFRRNK